MVSGSTIHKQKRKFFALVSVSSCLPPPTPTFYKTILRFLKSSGKRYSRDMKRSSSSYFNSRKQQSYVGLSVQLRRQGGKWRRRPRRKPRNRELWRKRRRRRGCWSTSNDSEMRCQRKKLSYWRRLKNPRLWGLNARRLPPEIRRGNSSLRRLKKSNRRSTTEVPQ